VKSSGSGKFTQSVKLRTFFNIPVGKTFSAPRQKHNLTASWCNFN